jgi:superfamily II DNA/RNA helicase
MRKFLPPDLQDKIIWFHSGMSAEFREEAIKKLKNGDMWGFWCTDAAGMVRVDISKVFQSHIKAGTQLTGHQIDYPVRIPQISMHADAAYGSGCLSIWY